MIDSLIKAAGIKVAEMINAAADPFDEFTRQPMFKTDTPLFAKARQFEDDMVQNFRLSTGIWNYKRPADGPITDFGDQATWHGIYTAMWAIKFSVTKDAKDSERLHDSLVAMRELRRNPVPSAPFQWILIRGVQPNTGEVRDDASNDSLTGHFAGIYFAWKYGEEPTRRLAVQYLMEICGELMEGDFAIHRLDGKPTTYGQLINGVLTDPLRLTLCLAILKTGAAAFYPALQSTYEKLWRRYGLLTSTAEFKFLWLTKTHEAHRAAIHLSILADLERYTPWRNTYIAGLRRIWKLERKSVNAWIFYLVSRHWQPPARDFDSCLTIQREFEFEDKGPNVERINSADATFWAERGVRIFEWPPAPIPGKRYLRASQPLPPWKRGSQDFFYQRHAFAVDDWLGNKQPSDYHNGGDFLIAHWGMRQLQLVGPAE